MFDLENTHTLTQAAGNTLTACCSTTERECVRSVSMKCLMYDLLLWINLCSIVLAQGSKMVLKFYHCLWCEYKISHHKISCWQSL